MNTAARMATTKFFICSLFGTDFLTRLSYNCLAFALQAPIRGLLFPILSLESGSFTISGFASH